MGYELRSQRGGELDLNAINWPRVVELALENGWEPAGTLAPLDWCDTESGHDPEQWGGGYCTNDGQYVTAKDARAMADALERSLNHAPEEVQVRDFLVPITELADNEKLPDDYKEVLVRRPEVAELPASIYFHFHAQHIVRETVDFSRRGGFYIW